MAQRKKAAQISGGVAALLEQPPNAPKGPEGFAKRLLWARLRKGWSLRRLADKAEVSTTTIGRVERGGETTSACAWAMAAALDVSAGWLAFGEGTPCTTS